MSFNSKSLPPPTAEQKRRWELMRKGCVCCRLMGKAGDCGPIEIHHLTTGGKHGAPRLGHDFTVALGLWHHRGLIEPWYHPREVAWTLETMEAEFGPSYARTPRAFRREFGPDEKLLEFQNWLIGWTQPPALERKRKSRCTASAKQVKRPTGGFAP